MELDNQLPAIFEKLSNDKRTNARHLALFSTLIIFWQQAKYARRFAINKSLVREACKIRSIKQYKRCIEDLNHWNYIHYYPAIDSSQDDLVSFCYTTELALINKSCKKVKRKCANKARSSNVITKPYTEASKIEEANHHSTWAKITQIIVQAVIQVLVAFVNKRFDLF